MKATALQIVTEETTPEIEKPSGEINQEPIKTQYWVLREITGSLKSHVYKIGNKFYQVVAYCDEKKYAYGFCGTSGEKVVYEVTIPNYDDSMRMEHKKNFTVVSRHLPIKKNIIVKNIKPSI